MTKYIKTTTTEFEQLDGWQKTFEKYGIRIESADDLSEAVLDELVPRGRYFLKTLEGELECHIGDWIATGVNGEHWAVKDEIFKKTYKKLPKLTRPVSRYLEHCKERWNLNDAFLNAEYLVPNNNDALEVFEYLSEHPEDFARAWLDGYEVEDE